MASWTSASARPKAQELPTFLTSQATSWVPTWLPTTLVIVASLLALEQWSWRSKKKHLPGVKWTIPVIGAFADSLAPTMEHYMGTWSAPLTAASVFNIFIVMVSDNALTRKVLNSPTYAEPCLTASAKTILVAENWVFLTGQVHVEYRKGLNTLFTRKALGIYLRAQEQIRRKHFAAWLAYEGPARPMLRKFRDINMQTSLYVFCGDHLSDDVCQQISDRFIEITKGFELVNFPLALPGTKVYTAIQARKFVVSQLERTARISREKILAGGDPSCLLDEWNFHLNEAGQINKFSYTEQALVVLSFIFASQDAMSSSITTGFQLLSSRPDLLAKVREEQERVRGGNYEADTTLELLDQMTYTRAFVKEVLRWRPPVIMVPYKTIKPMPITPDYTVPKNTILIPSFWNSTHDSDVYAEAHEFNPDRFMPGGVSEHADPKNYLVFGAGPHKCIGQEYVYMHMTSVLGSAAATMDMEHVQTELSDKIKIIPTLFPQDDCIIKFSPRR